MKYAAAHWTNGGTGLTNFDPSEVEAYEAAIKEHGDPDFFIERLPMYPSDILPFEGDFSLHCHSRKDTGEFFRVLRRVKLANPSTP